MKVWLVGGTEEGRAEVLDLLETPAGAVRQADSVEAIRRMLSADERSLVILVQPDGHDLAVCGLLQKMNAQVVAYVDEDAEPLDAVIQAGVDDYLLASDPLEERRRRLRLADRRRHMP